jgi:hypothetical protein
MVRSRVGIGYFPFFFGAALASPFGLALAAGFFAAGFSFFAAAFGAADFFAGAFFATVAFAFALLAPFDADLAASQLGSQVDFSFLDFNTQQDVDRLSTSYAKFEDYGQVILPLTGMPPCLALGLLRPRSRFDWIVQP